MSTTPGTPPLPARSSHGGIAIGPGPVVALVSAVVVVVSGALKWLDGNPGVTGYNVPAKFLVDVEVAQEGASIGLVLAVLAVVGAIGALVPRLRWLCWVAGAAILVVVALYVYQLGDFAEFVREADPFVDDDLGRGDLIGVGVYVAAAAGIGLVVGGVLGRNREP